MKKTMIFSTLMSVAMLGGCGTNGDFQSNLFTLVQTGVKPFKVKLTVDGDELTNDKGFNSDCTEFAEKLRKGCFVAESGEMLELEFKLKQPGGRVKWRFTKVMVCAGTAKPTGGNPCSLDSDQRADWVVVANNEVALMPPDGTIDLTAFSQQLRVFSVRDFNWHSGNYTYKIEACEEGSTAPDDCAWMDPGGTNKGRGR